MKHKHPEDVQTNPPPVWNVAGDRGFTMHMVRRKDGMPVGTLCGANVPVRIRGTPLKENCNLYRTCRKCLKIHMATAKAF